MLPSSLDRRDATIDSSARPMRPPTTRSRSDVALRRLAVAGTAMAAVGTGLVVMDGSLGWAFVRVVVIAAVALGIVETARRGSRRALAASAVAVGLIVTPAAGAITLSYVGASGVTTRALAGPVAAAGGIVLLGTGATLAVLCASGWRRLLAVPAALVLVYLAAFPVVTAVYATNVGRPELGAETPGDRGLASVDVSLTTTDGVQLSGWYIPSTNGAAVVLAHGASSTRSAVLAHAVVLAHHGYGVLLYDARGMGRSGGRAMNLGWYGDADIRAALDHLDTRADVAGRIAVVGESMGGEEAIGAMASDTRIKAVVAEGATNRVAGDWSWLDEEYGWRGRLQQGVQWLTERATDVLTDARPPITLRAAVAAARPRPVLLVAAGDVRDEQTAARSIQAASPDTVTVWVAAGAGHTGGLRTQPLEWERRVTGFLDAALLPPM